MISQILILSGLQQVNQVFACFCPQIANSNSFYYTNIAPQHKDFNQGAKLWLGLEDFVLNNTTEEGKRVSVFNGPIFSNNDDSYRGVPIPKVIKTLMGLGVRAGGFLGLGCRVYGVLPSWGDRHAHKITCDLTQRIIMIKANHTKPIW